MSLTIIRPIEITDAMMTACTVAENDYAAWSGATTYAAGNRVIKTSTHKVYESVQGGNLNHDPATDTAGTWWVEVSPTNRWKCLDTSTSTQTAQATSISYTLTPGQAVNAIGAVNVTGATSMRVRVDDPTYGVVYDETFDLSGVPVLADWWQWFYGTRRYPTITTATDLPSYPDADIIVDFSGTADLAIGVLTIGSTVTLAEGYGVRMGARTGIQDYSRKETNDWGDTVLVRRAYAKRVQMDLVLARGDSDYVSETLADLRATPCVWIASDQFSSLVVFGYYRDFSVVFAYATVSECSLEIEGLA